MQLQHSHRGGTCSPAGLYRSAARRSLLPIGVRLDWTVWESNALNSSKVTLESWLVSAAVKIRSSSSGQRATSPNPILHSIRPNSSLSMVPSPLVSKREKARRKASSPVLKSCAAPVLNSSNEMRPSPLPSTAPSVAPTTSSISSSAAPRERTTCRSSSASIAPSPSRSKASKAARSSTAGGTASASVAVMRAAGRALTSRESACTAARQTVRSALKWHRRSVVALGRGALGASPTTHATERSSCASMRSADSGASSAETRRFACGETAPHSRRGNEYAPAVMRASMVALSASSVGSKGCRAESMLYSSTPRAQMSTPFPYRPPLTISGAMYSSVPQ
mmetsp:Transcript_35028/g.79447  ORF Transcript_35028/g.79447 Transcript_35028/m.79447 type:complete len:337 (-) Transcript_35028:982-1992(-)